MYQGKAAVHTVDLINNTCISSQNYVVLYINVTFIKDSITAGEIIEDVLKTEISDNRLGNLPVSGTQYKVIFHGMYSFVNSSLVTTAHWLVAFQYQVLISIATWQSLSCI